MATPTPSEMLPPSQRFLFVDPLVAPDPGVSMFRVMRSADGETIVRAETDDPEAFIAWLRELFALFAQHPLLVRAAVLATAEAIAGSGLHYMGRAEIPPPAPALREPT